MRKILPIIICIAIICMTFASCSSDDVTIGNLTFRKDDPEIILSGVNVKDVSAVKKFTSLRRITLAETAVSDLSPLAETDVEEVVISTAEALDNLSDLKNVETLKKLTINNCTKILDFSVIAECKNLQTLVIKDSGLYNIDFLKEMSSLERLELKAKGVRDVAVLKELTFLKSLKLEGNKRFGEIEFLSGFTALEELKITDLEIKDISPVASLVSLEKLDFSSNNIEDVSPLADLKEMKELNLAANDIKDISPLKAMKKLEKLYIEGCLVTDIDVVKNLKNLKELYISSNKISSFSPIEKLTSLTSFFADNCGVDDITPLKGLDNLIHLQLSNNKIKDISPLNGKTKIIQLGLSYNNFEDASVISHMKDIITLDLSYCKNIRDIHFASELKEMSNLNLDGTRLDDEEVEHLRSHLTDCNISFIKEN